MLSQAVQKKLAQRYGGTTLVKEAFDQNLAKGFAVEFESERNEHAAVVMVDITGFSSHVSGWNAERIREFLDDYYKQVMPILFKFGGMIDRVAGDGILAVFSSFFTIATDRESERHALCAAERIVETLAGTAHSSKAAVSSGSLVFCKTGLADVYEEHTVIGEAITTAYRIEEIAAENQVIVERNAGFVEIIEGQIEATSRKTPQVRPVQWRIDRQELNLRGVGATKIYVEQLNL
jgi:class 3 adenylate cyclase